MKQNNTCQKHNISHADKFSKNCQNMRVIGAQSMWWKYTQYFVTPTWLSPIWLWQVWLSSRLSSCDLICPHVTSCVLMCPHVSSCDLMQRSHADPQDRGEDIHQMWCVMFMVPCRPLKCYQQLCKIGVAQEIAIANFTLFQGIVPIQFSLGNFGNLLSICRWVISSSVWWRNIYFGPSLCCENCLFACLDL